MSYETIKRYLEKMRQAHCEKINEHSHSLKVGAWEAPEDGYKRMIKESESMIDCLDNVIKYCVRRINENTRN